MLFSDFLPILIVLFSVYFLFKLRFFFILHPIKCIKEMLHALGDKQSRRSLCLALAGTLGVGNIVGVAIGIIIGGAGCVFWIFVSGFFSSVLKYCECALSADYKGCDGGGMQYTIKRSFRRIGNPLSKIYAFLCFFLSLSMGSLFQSNAVSKSLFDSVKIPSYISSFIFTLAVLITVCFFASKIDRFTELVIPFTTLVYIVIMLGVIFANFSRLPDTLALIIREAFTPVALCGGAFSFLSSGAIKEGFARGLLSNEAGAGTSAGAQTRQEGRGHVVGLMGMCEVFFDTTLLCTLTGVAIIAGTQNISSFKTGTDLIINTVKSSIGIFPTLLVPLLIFLFAYSTVICWYFYGGECLYFLCGKRKSRAYRVFFLLASFLGAFIKIESIVLFVDVILFFMTFITLLTLKKNSERIYVLSEKGGLLK